MDIKESNYASRKNAPLGITHDQAPGLPEGMDIVTTTFGRPVVKGIIIVHMVSHKLNYLYIFVAS